MSVRNVTKALGVLLVLAALFSTIFALAPRPTLQAQKLSPAKPWRDALVLSSQDRASNPAPASPSSPAEPHPIHSIPLALRKKIDPRVLKAMLEGAETLERPSGSPAKRRRDAGGGAGDAATAGTTAGAQARYIVHLSTRVDVSRVAAQADPKHRRSAVVEALRTAARSSQAALLRDLGQRQASGRVTRFTPYWIFNGVAVSSDLDTLLAVAARPEVELIKPDRLHRLPPVIEDIGLVSASDAVEWNIARVGAAQVWSAYGLRGQGTVVASLDSGVDWTHPALQRAYRGYVATTPGQGQHDHNWFDATDIYPTAPGDGDGHGTHTMGTMVGSSANGNNQIGVVPEARWITAKVFDDNGEAYDSWIHSGFQWMLAPTDINGGNPDPSLAPDVICCSFGDSDGADTAFWSDAHALRAAGIFAVFSVGNEHLGSLAANSPGSYPQSFSVGATGKDNLLAPWSCRGPSTWGEIKPEVTAPGVGIRSSLPGNRYAAWSGTSMATPHVAGVVALLRQAEMQYGAVTALAAPGLTITATEQVITQTARPLPDAASVPNNDYGWGLVDAHQAVGSVVQGGAFWGQVTDADTGEGIAQAKVTMVNQAFEGGAQAWTDPRGYYTFSVAAGIYDVTASRLGYAPQSVPEVEILAGATTQLDFRLLALPGARVAGRVTDLSSGLPLSATVRNLTREIQASTDPSGVYTLTLPLGSHVLEVIPGAVGHTVGRASITLELPDQIVVQDFALASIPRILLVDADAWYTVGEIEYYQDALDALLYTYDTWTVTERTAFGVGDYPPLSTLQGYDLVVWAQPLSSPGYIDAWSDLAAYLESGKSLLMAGQDIGYWDVSRLYGASEYEEYLHARYIRDDSSLRTVVGLSDTPFEGITVTLNAEGSAANQDAPSEIEPLDGAALAVFSYENDGAAGLVVNDCRGYRVVYLAFGLEGTGPDSARSEILRRAIDWLAQPQQDYAVAVFPADAYAVAPPGDAASYSFRVTNAGAESNAYVLSAEGSPWPAEILDAVQQRPLTTTVVLSPCSSVDLHVRVQVPDTSVSGETGFVSLTVSSLAMPSVKSVRQIRVTASAPWRSLAPLPAPRYRLAAAAVDDCRFLAIGGWGPSGEATRSTYSYDDRAGQWQTMPPKPTAAANIAAAAIDGKIYVPGGSRGDSQLTVLEIYDADADLWTSGADLPAARSGGAVAAAAGKLYVFGGNVGSDTLLSSTLEYDPVSQVWAERAPMPSGARSQAAAAALNGHIYVAGGWPALRTLERYDPATDSWEVLAPMPTGRQSPGLVSLDGHLYAIGGGDGWEGLSTVERYDPATGSWVRFAPLDSPVRAGVAAVATAGRIFVFGGSDAEVSANSAHEALAAGASLGSSGLVADTTAVAGGRLNYEITLRNPGHSPITLATLRDDIPAGTHFVDGSLVGGASYDPDAQRIEWQGSVAARSSKQFLFQVMVSDDLPRGTVITNSATVGDGRCGEHVLTATTVIEAVDLSHSHKTVDKEVASAGDVLHYALELRNVGAITATDVQLVDPIPPYLTYVAGSVQGAEYDPTSNRIEWRGALPPGMAGSYRYTDSDLGAVTYQWVDATVGGTSVQDGGDDRCLGPFDIGFPFEFYGTLYTQFHLNTNGQVLLGESDAACASYSNSAIPSSTFPNGFIAPFWDDLLSETGTIYYKLLGEAPNRQLAIEWHNVRHFGGTGALTFEVVLFEGSDEILIQYQSLEGDASDGSTATVGIEDQAGFEGVEYLFDGRGPGYPLHPGLAVLFTPLVGKRIEFQCQIGPDVPLKTLIVNQAQLTEPGRPALTLTASTRVDWVDVPLSRKTVDKPLAHAGDELAYLIELSGIGLEAPTAASLVDPIPDHLSYVDGSVQGATYNNDLDQIEWSGTLAPQAEGSYRWADSDGGEVTYQWLDATTGMLVPDGGDDRSLGPFDIGFPFDFYGSTYSSFYLNTNGQVLFGIGSGALSNVRIPNADTPNNFIAPLWDDLVSEAGTLYYRVLGQAPQRRLVMEWAGVHRFGSSDRITFEVVLHEGSNDILVQYHTLGGSAADLSATVGIENADGTEGVQYLYNDGGTGYPLHEQLAVLFEPALPQQIAFRARVLPDVSLNTEVVNNAWLMIEGQPAFPLSTTTWIDRIDLSESELEVAPAEVGPGARLTYTITLRNAGNATASSASLLNPIPQGTSYVVGTATAGAVYNPQQDRIEWRGQLGPRASQPVVFSVVTSLDALHNTPITNTVRLEDGLGNAVTKTVSALVQSHDLSMSSKTMPPTARPGEVFTCTVHLRNSGVISTSACLTDVLPMGVVLVPGSLWWSSGDGASDANSVHWHGDIVAQGLVVVRFQLQVSPDLAYGTRLTNTARISDPAGHVYTPVAETIVLSAPRTGPLYLPVVLRPHGGG